MDAGGHVQHWLQEHRKEPPPPSTSLLSPGSRAITQSSSAVSHVALCSGNRVKKLAPRSLHRGSRTRPFLWVIPTQAPSFCGTGQLLLEMSPQPGHSIRKAEVGPTAGGQGGYESPAGLPSPLSPILFPRWFSFLRGADGDETLSAAFGHLLRQSCVASEASIYMQKFPECIPPLSWPGSYGRAPPP